MDDSGTADGREGIKYMWLDGVRYEVADNGTEIDLQQKRKKEK